MFVLCVVDGISDMRQKGYEGKQRRKRRERKKGARTKKSRS